MITSMLSLGDFIPSPLGISLFQLSIMKLILLLKELDTRTAGLGEIHGSFLFISEVKEILACCREIRL